MVAVYVLAIVAAGVAIAWPHVRWPQFAKPNDAAPIARADWVNRLFSLAAAADISGEPEVAAAARTLIAALVGRPEPTRKAK